MARQAPGSLSILSISDVYKRQIQDSVPYKELTPFADAILRDRLTRQAGEEMRREFTVSYTHLDVYKRQNMASELRGRHAARCKGSSGANGRYIPGRALAFDGCTRYSAAL